MPLAGAEARYYAQSEPATLFGCLNENSLGQSEGDLNPTLNTKSRGS